MLHLINHQWYYWVFQVCAVSYLLGSIPFGLLLTRLAGAGDVRNIGSGNIGATNVLRTGHKWLALLTLLLDGSKGYAAITMVKIMYPDDLMLLAGLFVVLGHIFPVWLKFKGGKGIATMFGVFFAINWVFALSVCAMWLLIYLLSGFVSLASIVGIGYSWLAAYIIDTDITALLCLCMAPIALLTHRANIRRLLTGAEPQMRKGLL